MLKTATPGHVARRVVLRRALAAGAGMAAAAIGVRASRAGNDGNVSVDNFTFVPPLLRVRAGTTVIWTNHDDIPHSIVCPALNFHSHPMDTDGTVSFTFSQPGTFDYVCGLHPFMHAKVEVSG